MKKIVLTLTLLLGFQIGFAQVVSDYKTKNKTNEKDRTLMLDILRASVYQEFKQEFVFVVNHFKVSQNYAWFMGNAQRKDGKEIVFEDEKEMHDCCHVEALFKKSNGKWYIVESHSFSTDLWYDGIKKRYPETPKAIFPF